MKNGWFYNKNKEIPSEAATNNKINFLLKQGDPGSEPWDLGYGFALRVNRNLLIK